MPGFHYNSPNQDGYIGEGGGGQIWTDPPPIKKKQISFLGAIKPQTWNVLIPPTISWKTPGPTSLSRHPLQTTPKINIVFLFLNYSCGQGLWTIFQNLDENVNIYVLDMFFYFFIFICILELTKLKHICFTFRLIATICIYSRTRIRWISRLIFLKYD